MRTKEFSMRRRQVVMGGALEARHFEYRVTHDAYRSPVGRVHCARAALARHAHIAQLERDGSGVWRSTFAATLA